MRHLSRVLPLFFVMCGMGSQAQTISGNVASHDYVDLGLPSGTKWATYNVGATTPTQFGDRFAWGETQPKEEYSWDTYKWCKYKEQDMDNNPTDFTKYVLDKYRGKLDKKERLDAADDAATSNWGSAWRMPTKEEGDELLAGCTWEWTDNFNGTGVAGRIGTSKSNSNTIFLPAAGALLKEIFDDESREIKSGYWTSSIIDDMLAAYIFFDDEDFYSPRFIGCSVRAVLK